MILIGFVWWAIVVAMILIGVRLTDRIPAEHNVFRKPEKPRPPNPELVEALTKLGHKPATAKELAAKVDPDLDVEIALQVIYSEYGEL